MAQTMSAYNLVERRPRRCRRCSRCKAVDQRNNVNVQGCKWKNVRGQAVILGAGWWSAVQSRQPRRMGRISLRVPRTWPGAIGERERACREDSRLVLKNIAVGLP